MRRENGSLEDEMRDERYDERYERDVSDTIGIR
jgi:hypothetical protein